MDKQEAHTCPICSAAAVELREDKNLPQGEKRFYVACASCNVSTKLYRTRSAAWSIFDKWSGTMSNHICDICDNLSESCTCPVCPVCGQQGNRHCAGMHMPSDYWAPTKKRLFVFSPMVPWVRDRIGKGEGICYNAPRPLWGTETEDSWHLPFLAGRHYAILKYDDPRFPAMVKANESLDGNHVIWLDFDMMRLLSYAYTFSRYAKSKHGPRMKALLDEWFVEEENPHYEEMADKRYSMFKAVIRSMNSNQPFWLPAPAIDQN